MKKWKIRYLDVLPVLFIGLWLCKMIFTTDMSFSGLFSTLYSCIAYFVYGLAFAYFLNPLVVFLEHFIVKEDDALKKRKVKRGLSIAVVYLVVAGFISVFVINIIPTIVSGINEFLLLLPNYLASFQKWTGDVFDIFGPEIGRKFGGNLSEIITTFYSWFEQRFDVFHFSGVVTNAVSGSAKTVIRIVFGIVISVYFLFGKENFFRHTKRFVYATFSVKRADHILECGKEVNQIFFNFLISKLLQAFVVFVLGLVVLVPFDIPLAPLISLFLAVTNMIPYIGPWIGAVPSVLIALLFNPVKALIVLLFIIGMQIIDNLFIGPKIVSDRIGISPLLVIAGVAIGGTIGGIIGMFIGVPLVAAIKLVFYDKFIAKRLREKELDI